MYRAFTRGVKRTQNKAERLSLYLASRYPAAIVSDVRFVVRGFESEIHTFRLQRAHLAQKDYILRLFTGKGAAEKLTREARALSILQGAGYPVPALLLQEANPAILGKPFEIIEKLEGQALWHALSHVEAHLQAELLSRFGALLAQLHQLDWRAGTASSTDYEKNPILLLDEIISHYRSLYTKHNLIGFLQIVDWLDIHKHEISVRPAIVHQDFHANNVFLCPDDRLVVIDWTQFAVSDYRIDLAWTLLIMGDFGNADWGKQIGNAYTSASQDSVDQIEYFQVIVNMKLLASTVISITFGPEELGLRPETAQVRKEQRSIYKQLSQQLRDVTGIAVPELEDMLERI